MKWNEAAKRQDTSTSKKEVIFTFVFSFPQKMRQEIKFPWVTFDAVENKRMWHNNRKNQINKIFTFCEEALIATNLFVKRLNSISGKKILFLLNFISILQPIYLNGWENSHSCTTREKHEIQSKWKMNSKQGKKSNKNLLDK